MNRSSEMSQLLRELTDYVKASSQLGENIGEALVKAIPKLGYRLDLHEFFKVVDTFLGLVKEVDSVLGETVAQIREACVRCVKEDMSGDALRIKQLNQLFDAVQDDIAQRLLVNPMAEHVEVAFVPPRMLKSFKGFCEDQKGFTVTIQEESQTLLISWW